MPSPTDLSLCPQDSQYPLALESTQARILAHLQKLGEPGHKQPIPAFTISLEFSSLMFCRNLTFNTLQINFFNWLF